MSSKSNQPTLEINGQFFPIADLPSDVQELLKLFSKWDAEKTNAIDEVKKLDAAMKTLSIEISSRVAMWQANSKPADPFENDGLDGPNR